MMVLLPILILALVIAVTAFSSIGTMKMRLGQGKTGLWMLGGYFVLLLVSMIVSTFLPSETTASMNEESTHSKNRSEISIPMLIAEGKVDEVNKDTLVKEWSFELQDHSLTLEAYVENEGGPGIFIEKTSDLTGKIQASYYRSPIYVDGLKVQEEFKPTLVMNQQTLTVSVENPVDVHYQMFTSEFPFTQFSQNPGGREWGSRIEWGEEAVYIRVPEETEIIGENRNYTLIDPAA
ncbi:hypothetical protein JF544_11430 [Halobacillus kuroshimensis]|uniref:Uncharacterized protein n=1 Tax=Halobacillus kuroshimensis TaxID=302481 RepID=A0ABS3DWX1_9BACI|nr:hypothetical protein [Halobacillus kuroshimensis]MBN8235865.1 hypothetical protein [Halobacillus kuroshimensis]